MRCCYPSCGHVNAQLICTSECFQYKGTLDVFNKVARQVYNFLLLLYFERERKLKIGCMFNINGLYFQEGLARLWRGTNAGLALAIPTVSNYSLAV